MTTGAGTQGRDGGENLQTMADHWGTPTSRDYKDGSSANTAPTNGLLGRQVIQNWPTPDANTASYSNGVMGPNIREAALNWHTPSTEAHKSIGPKEQGRYGTDEMKTSDQRLRNQVDYLSREWRTPTAGSPNSMRRQGGQDPEKRLAQGHTLNLGDQVLSKNFPSSLPVPAIPDGPQSSTVTPGSLPPSQRKKLNPFFVTWMMNWPWWWTIPAQMPCAPVEMAAWLYRSRTRLQFLLGDRE
jgi:hypothetical protein